MLNRTSRPRRRRKIQCPQTALESLEKRELLSATADDHGSTTSSATEVESTSSTDGSLEARRDSDWFAFEARAGARYRIETDLGSLRDSVLYLRDANGRSIRYNDDGGRGLASKIEWEAPSDGTYFAEVRAYANRYTGSYQLQITELGSPETPVDDHGNTPATATSLAVGGTQTGVLEQGRDVDVFKMDLTAGQRYEFSTSLSSLRDSTLRLLGPNGRTTVAFNDDGGAGLASGIEFRATETDTYFLQVASYRGRYEGGYAISATEINDPHIEVGSTASGEISSRGGNQRFTFTAVAGTSYVFRTNLGTLRDSTLRLLDADGNRIAYNDDASGRGLASEIRWTAPTSGTFTLEVRAYSYRQRGTFTLDVNEDTTANTPVTFTPPTRRTSRIRIPTIRRIRWWG